MVRYTNKLKTTVYLFLLFVLLGCNFKTFSTKEFQAIKIFNTMPLVLTDGRIDSVKDMIPAIYYDHYFWYSISAFNLVPISENEFTLEDRYDEFVFQEGNKTGYFVFNDSLRGIRRVLVDSVLRVNAYTVTSENAPIFVYDDNNGLVKRTTQKMGNYRIDKYTPLQAQDPLLSPDTIFMFFDKRLNPLKFSLSKSLDKTYGLKLQKLILWYNSNWSDSLKMQLLAQRRYFVEIKIDSSVDKKQKIHDLDSILNRIKVKYPQDF